jgi:hypothetical protein
MGPVPGEPRVGSFDAKKQEAWLLQPVDQQIAWTTTRDVGKFVVAALLHAEQSANKALKVKSFIASHADVLAEFEKQTRVKWDVQYTSLEQLKMIEEEAWKNDSWWKYTSNLRQCWMRGETLYDEFDNVALEDSETETLAKVVDDAVRNAQK